MNLGMSSRQSRSGRDMRPVRAARSCSARPDWTARSYAPGASGAIGAESEEGRLPPPAVEPGVAVKPLPTWQAQPSNRPLPGTAPARVHAARGGVKRDAPGKKLRGG